MSTSNSVSKNNMSSNMSSNNVSNTVAVVAAKFNPQTPPPSLQPVQTSHNESGVSSLKAHPVQVQSLSKESGLSSSKAHPVQVQSLSKESGLSSSKAHPVQVQTLNSNNESGSPSLQDFLEQVQALSKHNESGSQAHPPQVQALNHSSTPLSKGQRKRMRKKMNSSRSSSFIYEGQQHDVYRPGDKESSYDAPGELQSQSQHQQELVVKSAAKNEESKSKSQSTMVKQSKPRAQESTKLSASLHNSSSFKESNSTLGNSSVSKSLVLEDREDESFDSTLTIGKPISTSTHISNVAAFSPQPNSLVVKIRHPSTTQRSSPLKTARVITNHSTDDSGFGTPSNQDHSSISDWVALGSAKFKVNNDPLSIGDPSLDANIISDLNLTNFVKDVSYNSDWDFVSSYTEFSKRINDYEQGLMQQLYLARFKMMKRFDALNRIVNEYGQSLDECDERFESKVHNLKHSLSMLDDL